MGKKVGPVPVRTARAAVPSAVGIIHNFNVRPVGRGLVTGNLADRYERNFPAPLRSLILPRGRHHRHTLPARPRLFRQIDTRWVVYLDSPARLNQFAYRRTDQPQVTPFPPEEKSLFLGVTS